MRSSVLLARATVATVSAAVTAIAAAGAACAPAPRIDVVAAASLRPLVEAAASAAAASGATAVPVRVQTGGSAALARRVAELDLHADLLLLADGALFDELLADWSDFWIGFASDRLVIAYTEGSRYAAQLDAQRWPAILLRPDVDVAMADPDLAPVGYRTLQALRLWDLSNPQDPVADRLLAAARANYRPDVAEMLAPLQAGAVDYAFLYRSTALQAGLRMLALPPEVDLGDPSMAAAYARVEVLVAGDTPSARVIRRGAPIEFGIAPGRGASVAADDLLRWILGPEGREWLRAAGFGVPARVVHGAIDPARRHRLGLSESSSVPR